MINRRVWLVIDKGDGCVLNRNNNNLFISVNWVDLLNIP